MTVGTEIKGYDGTEKDVHVGQPDHRNGAIAIGKNSDDFVSLIDDSRGANSGLPHQGAAEFASIRTLENSTSTGQSRRHRPGPPRDVRTMKMNDKRTQARTCGSQ